MSPTTTGSPVGAGPVPGPGASGALTAMERERLVHVVRGDSARDAAATIEAAVAGGVRIVEVTYTVPEASALISSLAGREGITLGAGTVRTPAEAESALAAGARFLVSPNLDLDVVRLAVAADVLVVPGILTATEAQSALGAGAPAVKLFPASAVGPDYLRALHGPMPELRVMPSGGIGPTNAAAWLDAGAFAVGMGGGLSPAGEIDDAARASITAAASAALDAVTAANQTVHRTAPRTANRGARS
jgi:2-dehydro-3-deoxyphosphogluconate aldolase/(4S)-4-hydroxy-2-oxoglutarate aldolase